MAIGLAFSVTLETCALAGAAAGCAATLMLREQIAERRTVVRSAFMVKSTVLKQRQVRGCTWRMHRATIDNQRFGH